MFLAKKKENEKMIEETAIRIAKALEGIETGLQIVICLIVGVIAGVIIFKILER